MTKPGTQRHTAVDDCLQTDASSGTWSGCFGIAGRMSKPLAKSWRMSSDQCDILNSTLNRRRHEKTTSCNEHLLLSWPRARRWSGCWVCSQWEHRRWFAVNLYRHWRCPHMSQDSHPLAHPSAPCLKCRQSCQHPIVHYTACRHTPAGKVLQQNQSKYSYVFIFIYIFILFK